MTKKLLILNGGPRLAGNTMELIKAFTEGAEAARKLGASVGGAE